MPIRVSVRVAAIVAIAALVSTSQAFAREKVRDERFDWQVLKTEHFDVHFYGDDVLPRAREVGAWLERARTRLGAELKVAVARRTPVFLYRCHNHFEQTNLFPEVPEGVGAFADGARDRIVIPLYPSQRYLQTVLEHELVHIFQFAALYPYRIPSYALLVSWLHPQWLIEGMADHLAPPRTSDAAMRLRDSALDGTLRSMFELRGFSHLNPHEVRGAYEQGAFFIDYLDEVSGGGSAMRLLRMFAMQIPWSVDTVFALATGASLREADRTFRERAQESARAAAAGRSDPGAFRLTDDTGHYRVNNRSAVWNPDGTRIAFLSDRTETTAVYVMDADGTNVRRLLRNRLNATIEFVRGGDSALAWTPDGSRVCFVGEWTNREYLYLAEVDGRGLRRIELPFDELGSPDVSPDGRSVALSGVRAGVSDIFVADLETERLRQLSDTRAHDASPRWSPDGRSIAYSSETGGQTDIDVVDVETGAVRHLTRTDAHELQPSWSPDGTRIAYSCDAGGISNIWIADAASGQAERLTDVIGGAFSPAWSRDGSRILFAYYRHGNTNIHVTECRLPPEGLGALPADDRAAELAIFTTTSAEGSTEALRDHMALETLMPLVAMNPFSLSDLRGDHQIVGDVMPYVSEMGTTWVTQISWLDLSRRVDLAATGFNVLEASQTVEDRDTGMRVHARYPLDHFRRIEVGYIGYRRERTTIAGPGPESVYSGVFAAVRHDNRLGRLTDATAGCTYGLEARFYDELLGSDRSLSSVAVSHSRYVALTRDQVLAMRLSADASEGPQPEEFDLSMLVRGLEPNAFEDQSRFAASLEYRFPLVRDVNANILGSYVMLKDVRAYLYGDAGYVTDARWSRPFDDLSGPAWHYSYGAGVRFDLYLLQQLPVRVVAEAQCVDRTWQHAYGLVIEFGF